MGYKISTQEKELIKSYNEDIDNWFKTKYISVPSSLNMYEQIIAFLSKKLNIGIVKNTSELINKLDASYFSLNKDFGINKLTEILYEIPKAILFCYYKICEEILNSFEKFDEKKLFLLARERYLILNI